MDDDPTKTARTALREHNENIERMNAGRRESALHETAHVGVGIMEGVMSPTRVEDPYTPLHRADEIAAVILKVVTVLALTFGLFEYDRQKADARVTESLSLVQEWETGGYQDAYTRVNDLLQPAYQQSASLLASMSDADKAIALANIGEAITGNDDHAYTSVPDRDVDKVFHFFERAAICADEAICDYPVLKTFFGSEASSFWLYFSRYAESRQADGYAGYGEWAHRFVDGGISRAKFLGIF